MSNMNHSSRKTICCILGVVFFSAFGAHAAVSSPDPDNAALLYYQAFLLRPEPDEDTYLLLMEVLDGAKPSARVREYLDMVQTRETLRIAEAATEILDCSWGILRSECGYSLTAIGGELRQLVFLLEVDARTLAADGECRRALGRCLSIRRLAEHIADEAVLGYLFSLSADYRALLCIQHVLGLMFPDVETLTWLQGQLSTVQGALPSPGKAIEITLDDTLKLLHMRPELLAWWREDILEHIEDESAKQEFLSLTDEELLESARESYNRFLASINRVIGSDIPYEQKYVELQQFKEELEDHAIGDPVGVLSFYMQDDVVRYHDLYVHRIANFNAIRVAIEIYLMKAETGQLPEKLPRYHLPKDPFNAKDFEYEVTKDGFLLRHREKEIGANMLWKYEFKVRSNSQSN